MLGKIKSALVVNLLFVSIISLTACGISASSKKKVELTISAAVSLTESLTDIKSLYEGIHGDVKVNYNFAGSGSLQQQIEQGAPVDVFLSAGKKQMQALVDKQLIAPKFHMNLLHNELVMVVPVDAKLNIISLEDLLNKDVKSIAMGQPDNVPAGTFAKEALLTYKLWDALQSKIVLAKDVRQVLTYVETGNSDAGFVYKTDARTSKKAKILITLDPLSYSLAEYHLGLIKATKHRKEAQQFYEFLQTYEALVIFTDYGFSLPVNI